MAKLAAAEKRATYATTMCAQSPLRVKELQNGDARFATIAAQKEATKNWCEASTCRAQ